MPTRVVAVDATEGLKDLADVKGYQRALALIRVHGRSIGCLQLPVLEGKITAKQLYAAITNDGYLGYHIGQASLKEWLLRNQPKAPSPVASWSIIVCTRDRIQHLKRCLDALVPRLGAVGELVIVDNDPPNEETRRLVAGYPRVVYVREPRRGLNAARRCGARTARGEVLIYTDDDVVVDEAWVDAILEPFSNPRVGAVTGLTMPLELETAAQAIFEYHGSHYRGFERCVFDDTIIPPASAGQVGSGANMAFRRKLALKLGIFDAELDMGSVAMTGGDAHAFYQILRHGYQIVYTPDALVWHCHRREYQALRDMLYAYSVGGVAHLTRCFLQYGDWQALEVACWWLTHHHLWHLWRSFRRKKDANPLDLTLAELAGFFKGPLAYLKARKIEQARA